MKDFMEFQADWRTYNTRYFSWLIYLLSFVIGILLITSIHGKLSSGFNGLNELFLYPKFLIYFFGFLLVIQIINFLTTQKNVKFLRIQNDKLVFTFFNNKTLELKYFDLYSLELTKDKYKKFEFTFKNGEKKIVYALVKDKMKAFELINQKIQKS